MIRIFIVFLSLVALVGIGCGGEKTTEKKEETPKSSESAETADPMQNKGIGPIKELVLPETIDQDLVAVGAEHYKIKCSACHKAEKKYIGPAPKGIMSRRSPEWIMNMILNPEEMIEKDPIAKALLMEYNGAPMANQSLTEEEARAILEYFRTLN